MIDSKERKMNERFYLFLNLNAGTIYSPFLFTPMWIFMGLNLINGPDIRKSKKTLVYIKLTKGVVKQ